MGTGGNGPVSLEQVEDYARQNHLQVDPGQFFAHYQSTGWKDKEGRSLKDWQKVLASWSGKGSVITAGGRPRVLR